MKFLRIWRRVPPLVHEQADLLREEVTVVLAREGLAPSEETGRECTLFILWSVHAGLMNIRPALVRNALLWLHRRKVAHTARAGDPDLLPLYERRRIEALYAVRNIFAEQTPRDWMLPLSSRLARMFIRNASAGAQQVSRSAIEEVLRVLRPRSSACVRALLSA